MALYVCESCVLDKYVDQKVAKCGVIGKLESNGQTGFKELIQSVNERMSLIETDDRSH